MASPKIPTMEDMSLGSQDDPRLKQIWFRFFDQLVKALPVNVTAGSGSPEGVVTGSPSDVYFNTDGGAGTTFYVKESGVGTKTGWAGK